jgi:predicted alpha/beta-fold hydrolase
MSGALIDSSYVAPAWLPGGNLQTIYAALFVRRMFVPYRRERWDTPDGDFVDVDWLDGPPGAPLVVLFHGLEGSSGSHYALALMNEVRKLGWSGVVYHFRGCSGEINRLPRAYHSGDSAEIDWALRRLKANRANLPLLVVGVSLGGNALLKWLGEEGETAKAVITAAVSVSAPLDLSATGHTLAQGFNMVYTRMFLNTLKKKVLDKLSDYPDMIDATATRRARNLYEFDNAVTAPLHGFRDTDDYWTRASAKPWLEHVALPALVLNAKNDPFMPASALPQRDEVSRHVMLEFPETGGHVSFITGPFPGNLHWLPRRVIGFLADSAAIPISEVPGATLAVPRTA